MRTENDKQYLLSIEELQQKLGIKEKITFVHYSIWDNTVTIKVEEEKELTTFPVWVRWKNISGCGTYDEIQWSNNENIAKKLKGFHKYEVTSYNDFADRLDKDFSMNPKILKAIRNHDRMRTKENEEHKNK